MTSILLNTLKTLNCLENKNFNIYYMLLNINKNYSFKYDNTKYFIEIV